MIDFEKEKALAGEPVITRGGRVVKSLRYYLDGRKEPWRADVRGVGTVSWKAKGKHETDYNYDLFMKSPEPEPELLTWYAVVGSTRKSLEVHKSSKTSNDRVVYLRTCSRKWAEINIKKDNYLDCEVIEVKGKKLFNVKDIK